MQMDLLFIHVYMCMQMDLLIAGMPSIDLDDWETHTDYMGSITKDSQEAKWYVCMCAHTHIHAHMHVCIACVYI